MEGAWGGSTTSYGTSMTSKSGNSSRWMGKSKGGQEGEAQREEKRKIRQRYEKMGRKANKIRQGGVLGIVGGKAVVVERSELAEL